MTDAADDPIRHFRGRYAFLSNFAPSPLEIDGITYPTAEHAFQAHQTSDPEERSRIAAIATPARTTSVACSWSGVPSS